MLWYFIKVLCVPVYDPGMAQIAQGLDYIRSGRYRNFVQKFSNNSWVAKCCQISILKSGSFRMIRLIRISASFSLHAESGFEYFVKQTFSKCHQIFTRAPSSNEAHLVPTSVVNLTTSLLKCMLPAFWTIGGSIFLLSSSSSPGLQHLLLVKCHPWTVENLPDNLSSPLESLKSLEHAQ